MGISIYLSGEKDGKGHTEEKGIMKMAVLLVVEPYRLIRIYRRLRGPYCINQQGDDGGSKNSYQTALRYNPEDSHLRTHRHQNLSSHYTSVIQEAKFMFTYMFHEPSLAVII
jgi:hypothetical protein